MGISMALLAPRIGLMAKGNQDVSVQACSNHLVSKQLGKKTYISLCRYGICVGSGRICTECSKTKNKNMDNTILKEIMDYEVHGTFPEGLIGTRGTREEHQHMHSRVSIEWIYYQL